MISYFHVQVTLFCKTMTVLSTCISKNVPKCILKYAVFQYYPMKSKNFLLLIIYLNNIHGLNILWILPKNQKVSLICIVHHPYAYLVVIPWLPIFQKIKKTWDSCKDVHTSQLSNMCYMTPLAPPMCSYSQ